MTCRNGIVGFCQTGGGGGGTNTIPHLFTDQIDDISGNGVLIEGVLIKDGTINGVPVTDLTDHINDFNNPHMVTATQVGLGPTSNPTFNSVIVTSPPTLPNNLVTKAYVDALVTSGITFYDITNSDVYITTNTETSGGFLTHNTLNVPTADGRYRIGWCFDWCNASTTRNMIARLNCNSTILETFVSGFSITGRPEVIPNSQNDQRQKMSGFSYYNITGIATSIFTITFACSDEGFDHDPITMANSKLEVWKVS